MPSLWLLLFEPLKGGALFEMEKDLSAKDSRFKLGEEFKEDIQVKPDMSIQAKMKVMSHTGSTKLKIQFGF